MPKTHTLHCQILHRSRDSPGTSLHFSYLPMTNLHDHRHTIWPWAPGATINPRLCWLVFDDCLPALAASHHLRSLTSPALLSAVHFTSF